MLLKLISISQLICEVIGLVFEQLSNYNVIIMSMIAKNRDGFRKICREQELTKIKNSLRNLVIYCPELSGNQCSMCQNDRWLYGRQNISNICSVIVTIFHNSHICQIHVDVFVSKILQYMILNPPLFGELIKSNEKQTIRIILLKIIVLYQIFGNDSVINNSAVKQYIQFNFHNRNEFIVKLMECAYFNEQFLIQRQKKEQGELYDLNRICFACLYSIIIKNPSLFLSYFDQFPFDQLIMNSKGQRLTNIIRFIGEIIVENHEISQDIHLINIVYTSFKNHLRVVQGVSSNFQALESYIELIELLLRKLDIKDEQMINLVIYKIVTQLKMANNLRQSISNISQIILHKYLDYLTQINTQNFQKILQYCNQLHSQSHSKPIQMQAQPDKPSMQLQ